MADTDWHDYKIGHAQGGAQITVGLRWRVDDDDVMVFQELSHLVGDAPSRRGGEFQRVNRTSFGFQPCHEPAPQAALRVNVHQRDAFALPQKTNGEIGGNGGLARAAFLLRNCDDVAGHGLFLRFAPRVQGYCAGAA